MQSPGPVLTVVWALLAIALVPASALAQVITDEAAYEEMLVLSDEATEAVLNDQFEFGAIKFRQAYAAYPDPILLKNEMISWFRAGDCRSALPPAQAFLKTDDVQPEDQDDVEVVQLECHLRLAEEALEGGNLVLASYHLDSLAPLERPGAAEERYLALRSRLETHSPPSLEVESSAASAAVNNRRRDLGWLQLSAGIAAVGAGAAMHTVALDRQAQLRQLAASEAPTDALIFHRRQQDWGPYQRMSAWVVPSLYGLGALAIGSGTFFLLRSGGGEDTPKVSLAPEVGPEQVGVHISGRF